MKTLFTPKDKQPRKHLAQVIGTILGGIKPTYLGAPSMAYQIAPVTLDRDWTVTWPTGLPARDVDLIEAVATQEGYKVARSAGSPEQAAAGGLTFAFPTTGWEEHTQVNLEAMLASKGKLIAKALSTAVVPVGFEGGQVIFPWFADTPEPEVVEATTVLLAAMIKAAGKAKRVSAKPPAGTNEKYAMRCFLLRLGFIGDQHKTARRILTRYLDGNAAWANPPAAASDADARVSA